jgi:hypothetical protein
MGSNFDLGKNQELAIGVLGGDKRDFWTSSEIL